MFGLEALTFGTQLALGGFLLLPLIWWLMRFTPPRPKSVRFPPFRLLLDLISHKEEADRMPWWLIALRLAIAALVILGVSRALLSANPETAGATGPMLIVVDDGWPSAQNWDLRQAVLANLIDEAARSGDPVALATTSPGVKSDETTMLPAEKLRENATALVPRALAPDRPATLKRLQAVYGKADSLRVVWLADGVDTGKAQAFAAGLQELAGGKAQVRAVVTPAGKLAPVVLPPVLSDGKLKLSVLRAPGNSRDKVVLQLRARNGRALAESLLQFKPGDVVANGEIALPVELRNEAASLRIAGERSAAGVYLFDDRWRRKTLAYISGASLELAQPLLDPLYYVGRALEPSAEIREIRAPGDLKRHLDAGLSMLVVADVGIIATEDRALIAKWVERGGVLLRFAGPRLAGGHDELVPVELRDGGRALGSALSWEQPQRMADFSQSSPFAGLSLDPSVLVKRQVLAQPSAELTSKSWANLEDGTPLITAAGRGNGLVVLFHITANADWSNLPLTGLFVELLNRILAIAPGAGIAGTEGAQAEETTSGAFTPTRSLSGFGVLTPPLADARPITADRIAKARPSFEHPAGLYGRGGAIRALNLDMNKDSLKPIEGLPQGIQVSDYEPVKSIPLSGTFFTLAFILFLIDCAVALVMSGQWRRLRPGYQAAAVLLAVSLLAPLAAVVQAQNSNLPAKDQFALRNALETRIAYVITGDSEIDKVSFAGLSGLNDILLSRTSIEPGNPVGIDIERDEIVFFPLLYWPVQAVEQKLSEKAIAKIDRFMKNGGTIFFDTRDHDTNLSGITGAPSAAMSALRGLLKNLDIPALEPVPAQHVLTKAFYLLQSFPGRYSGGRLWVETANSGRKDGNSDGVTSIIIGSNDYAAAWATLAGGKPMFPVVPGGERQREFAYRSGVNIVMYALTGNYKADQVHVPALLERLGQ